MADLTMKSSTVPSCPLIKENTLAQAVTALDVSMYYEVYITQDFSQNNNNS